MSSNIYFKCSGCGETSITPEQAEAKNPVCPRCGKVIRGPTRVPGRQPRSIDISGYVFAIEGARGSDEVAPVLFHMVGTNKLFWPVFETTEKLKEFHSKVGKSFYAIKQIMDMGEFQKSLPGRLGEHPLELVVDPHITETGSIRFTALLLN